MNKEVRAFLTPALKGATEDELKRIGIVAFGSNLGYLEKERKDILNEFNSSLGSTDEDGYTRQKLHYIINYVESYDRNEKETVKTGGGLSFKKDLPGRRLTVKEIINELNK